MAKRRQDSHGGPQQWQRQASTTSNQHGQRSREQGGQSHYGPRDVTHIAKKAKRDMTQKKASGFNLAKDPKDQIIQGNAVRGAVLLTQLVNEFANSESSLEELKNLAGEKVASQVLQLQETLQPRAAKIKDKLHRLPKFPPSALPVATFPPNLLEALNTSVSANKYTVPPLPPILDPELAKKPFIHRSCFANEHKRAITDSYERLELLGDAYIEIIATRLLYPMYPNLPAGRLSAIRETLVCNETLAAFSLAYDFGSRAQIPDTYREEGTGRPVIWTKLLGDFFEAYIAAVILSDPENGFNRAEEWMRALWAPRLPDVNVVTDPDKGAKQALQRRVGGVGVRVNYESEREPEAFRGGMQWFIRCTLTGWGFESQVLGRFTGRSKQVAELGAAEEAMLNPLTAQAQAIKVKYDEKTRKERAEAAEAQARAVEHVADQ